MVPSKSDSVMPSRRITAAREKVLIKIMVHCQSPKSVEVQTSAHQYLPAHQRGIGPSLSGKFGASAVSLFCGGIEIVLTGSVNKAPSLTAWWKLTNSP